MSEQWEVFNKIEARQSNGVPVVIYKNGYIALVQRIRELIDSEYVTIAYSKSKNAIGLIPAKTSDANGFKIVSPNGRGRKWIIRSSSFFNHFDLLTCVKCHNVVFDDGMLVIYMAA